MFYPLVTKPNMIPAMIIDIVLACVSHNSESVQLEGNFHIFIPQRSSTPNPAMAMTSREGKLRLVKPHVRQHKAVKHFIKKH